MNFFALCATFALCFSFAYAQVDLSGVFGTRSSNTVDESTPVPTAPSPIDLLVDADSYVPPFYRGRALPSAGTHLRLQAIAHFRRADGSYVSPADIVYTWKQDGRVLGSLSGSGRSSAIIPSPTLFATSNIHVDAHSSDGAQNGSASVVIPSVEPLLLLYENNPLVGLTFYRALEKRSAINTTEVTFAVVPYFAQVQNPNDPRLIYAWSVNDSPVVASVKDPSEITINATHSNGLASINLTLTHASNIFMDSTGAWDVQLGGNTSSTFGSPTDGTKDPFSGLPQ